VGVTTFNIVATNSAGSDTETFTLTTNAAAPPTNTATPPSITTLSTTFVENQSNTFQLQATGSPAPTFALANDGSVLPDGVTLSSSGVLSGSPTQVGVTTFNIVATNSAGSDTETFVLTTNAVAPSLTLAAPSQSYSPTPTVTLTYNNPYLFDFSDPVSINVDLQHDGSFTDPGDQGYATTTLMTGYYKDVTLPALQPGEYAIQAVLTDSTGAVYTAYNDITVSAAPSGRVMIFEPNVGQTDPSVAYLAHGQDYTGFLSATGATFSLAPSADGTAGSAFQISLYGANANATAVGLSQMASYTNYLIGDDPSQWHTNVANYGGVLFQNVYQNVDVQYTGNGGQMEATYIVNPGGSVGSIALEFGSWGTETVTPDGQLLLHNQTTGEVMDLSAPVLYQLDASGNKEYVSGQYVTTGNSRAGFMVTGSYDPTRALYIDPSIVFSTFLGGSQNDSGNGIAVDAAGNSYAVGTTSSTNFPVQNPVPGQGAQPGNSSAFVSKFSPAGALLFSTYLGGTQDNAGNAIAVEPQAGGNIFVTGSSDGSQSGTHFPTTIGSFHRADFSQTGRNAWVASLNSTGTAINWATMVAGSDFQQIGNNGMTRGAFGSGNGIAVDANGNVFVTGVTANSGGAANSHLITQDTGGNNTNIFQPNTLAITQGSGANGFVLELNPTGSGQVYSTYLTGTSFFGANMQFGFGTTPNGIALDSNDNAYVVGQTNTNNLPTQNQVAGQAALGGHLRLGFIAAISPSGNLVYSSVIGGSNAVNGFGNNNNANTALNGVAVDANADAYFVGTTNTTDFATVGSPFEGSYPGGRNAAVVGELDPTGATMIFSTFLGVNNVPGNNNNFQNDGDTQGNAIALDNSGNVYVAGSTDSFQFPNVTPVQSPLTAGRFGFGFNNNNFGTDGFVSVFTPGGGSLSFSTNFGGIQNDSVNGIAVDKSTNFISIVGTTSSTSVVTGTNGFFPIVNAFQVDNGGKSDAFVAVLNPAVPAVPPPPPPGVGPSQPNQTSDTATDLGTLSPGQTQSMSSAGGQPLQIDTQPDGFPDYNWFRWTAGGSGAFTATINTTSGGFLELEIFTVDPTDNTLVSLGVDQALSNTHTLSTELTAGQVILVEVKGQNLSLGVQQTGVYNMTVSLS
jgi:hypothetical protein